MVLIIGIFDWLADWPAMLLFCYLASMNPHFTCAPFAVLYGCGGNLLGANVIFMLAIVPWVGILSYLCLLAIKHSVGLRVPLHVEEMGMDK